MASNSETYDVDKLLKAASVPVLKRLHVLEIVRVTVEISRLEAQIRGHQLYIQDVVKASQDRDARNLRESCRRFQEHILEENFQEKGAKLYSQ